MRITPFARSFIRKRATLLLDQTCRITRPVRDARVTYDPVTRKAVTASGAEVYEGPCRLYEMPVPTTIFIGAEEVETVQLMLAIPWDAAVPKQYDLVEMVKYIDSSMDGRWLQVQGVVKGGGLRGSRQMRVAFAERET